jgi:hypothetical protein
MRQWQRVILMAAGLAASQAAPLLAASAWVPASGKGSVYFGFSRKTAASSWNAFGDTFDHTTATGDLSWHDFRYLSSTAEIGLGKGFSVGFTGTWLYGLEGPKAAPDKGVGLSDAWFSARWQLPRSVRSGWPVALVFGHRNPFAYDMPGPYSRFTYDAQGKQREGLSPEWRGVLKRDYSVSAAAGRSFAGYRAWANLEAGYTFREGAASDQVFVNGDVGYPLPWLRSHVKAASVFVHSAGSDSPRQPDDRFGSRADYNFNKASMLKLGAALLIPFGPGDRWSLEVGYNQWLWGRSARRYKEPYVSLGRSF